MVPPVSRSLGCENSRSGLCYRFCGDTPFQGTDYHTNSFLSYQEGGHDPGNRQPSDQERSGTSAGRGEGSRLLFNTVPCPQESGGLEASAQSETSEPLCGEDGFQAGFHKISQKRDTNGGFCNIPGSAGCIPSHSYSPRSQEIPQVPLQWGSLAVSSSPIRPVVSPTSFLPGPGSGSGLVPFEGHPPYGLPGRLATAGFRSNSAGTTDPPGAQHALRPGLASIGEEVSVNTAASFPFHRGSFRSNKQHSDTFCSQNPFSQWAGWQVEPISLDYGQGHDESPGSSGLADRDRPIGQVTHERPSNVFTPAVASETGLSAEKDNAGSESSRKPSLVGSRGQLADGRPNLGATQRGMHNYRCIPEGMGSSLGGPHSTRSVAQSRERSHQCSRDEGSETCHFTLVASVEEQENSGSIRQHINCPVYQQAGGHGVPQTVPVSSGYLGIGNREWALASCGTHKRRIQCDSGLALQGKEQDSLVGVGFMPKGSKADFCTVWDTKHRSVCVQAQQQIAHLLQLGPGSGSICEGQSEHGLGEHMGICLPPNFSHTTGAAEDPTVKCKDPTHSPVVASQTLVPQSPGASGGHSSNPSISGEPAATVSEQGQLSRSRVTEADSVATFQRQLVKEGIPTEARQMVLASWRPSTVRVYAAQYRVFCRWCDGVKKHPSEASLEDVLRFLQHLFDKGLQYRTICVYRSMLSNVLPPVRGVKMGEVSQVVRFLKGVFNSRPPKKTLVPDWDLPLVLDVLSAPPFEPMGAAPVKLVTLKFTFLLAVTTARRVSDLSKLSIGDHCRVQKGRITFLPTSLAKADDPSHFQQEVVIRTFKEKKLCPIRSLKWYLRKTEGMRQRDPMVLLRCLNAPFDPPSTQTISRWLVNLIKMAYDVYPHLPRGNIRAHSTRAMAPNWAHFKGATKHSILQAADWRRENTFIKYYARDLKETGLFFGSAVLSAAQLSER